MRLIAQNLAIDLVKEGAFELGKEKWLVDPWGRAKKQTLRDQHTESERMNKCPPQKKKQKKYFFCKCHRQCIVSNIQY